MGMDNFLFGFVFYYPLFMAYMWMIGGITYYLRYERKALQEEPLAALKAHPSVTVVVPCHNESGNVRELVETLHRLNYPNYEILCVNDGSTDDTGAILDALLGDYPKLRVIHHAQNQGKAVALNTATAMANSEYLMCIDADAVLDPDAVPLMLRHFEYGPRLGAVTGNPRIRTRSTLLGRIQVGEFSSIVGLIKRTQRIYGRLFTASGVATMFRRRAVLQCGLWSPDMLTEDIDISWKLQFNHWDVRFEPRALCWILMPETLKGLWSQRLRWAMGGVQTIIKYFPLLLEWRRRRMWLIYIEYVTSVVWAYAIMTVMTLGVLGLFVNLPEGWSVNILPGWHGALIGTTCLIQVFIGALLDRRYDVNLLRHSFWMIWYPLVYWMLNMLTTVWAVPKTLLRKSGRRAVWKSPDRGVPLPGQGAAFSASGSASGEAIAKSQRSEGLPS